MHGPLSVKYIDHICCNSQATAIPNLFLQVNVFFCVADTSHEQKSSILRFVLFILFITWDVHRSSERLVTRCAQNFSSK